MHQCITLLGWVVFMGGPRACHQSRNEALDGQPRSKQGGELLNGESNSAKVRIHSFIHSGYFCSAFSSPLLLRGAPKYSIDTVSELTSPSATSSSAAMGEGLAQGPYVTTWWLEWDFNLRVSGCKASNLPLSHHAPLNAVRWWTGRSFWELCFTFMNKYLNISCASGNKQ